MSSVLAPLSYFTGAIQIVAGIFLIFFGKTMLNITIILLSFLVLTMGSFLVLFNLGAVPGLD